MSSSGLHDVPIGSSTTTTTGGSTILSTVARQAVADHPGSCIEIAMEFCQTAIPDFVGASNDRLVKLGRRIQFLVQWADQPDNDNDNSTTRQSPLYLSPCRLESSLELLVEECQVLLAGTARIPTVRFGKTGLQMPIATVGGMRFQQAWGTTITTMDQVSADCQDNLVAILRYAILELGMRHIETARGYGSSELQLGVAIQQLLATSPGLERKDLIIQTKTNPTPNPADFRANLELSMSNLKVDYLDLFAVHGLNLEEQFQWVFGQDGHNCMAVVQEFVNAGKIRHVGFSTHGPTDLIRKSIETGAFEYVNLHYHYFGSYTVTGGGPDGMGNLDNIRLLQEHDMGIFVISPYDKGGKLYAPSKKLCSLTWPDMEPITFKSLWVWNHHRLYSAQKYPQIHTFTVGVGRPSDLDQLALAAHWHTTQRDSCLTKLKAVTARLDQAMHHTVGKVWAESWWQGLPKSMQSVHLVEHNQIVWLYNMILAFGLYTFAKDRYGAFEGNYAKWDDSLSPEENIAKKIGKVSWGYVPGLPLLPGVDYSDDLRNVPAKNVARVKQAETFVYDWCRNPSKDRKDDIQKVMHVISRAWDTSSQQLRAGLHVPQALGGGMSNLFSALTSGFDELEAENQKQTAAAAAAANNRNMDNTDVGVNNDNDDDDDDDFDKAPQKLEQVLPKPGDEVPPAWTTAYDLRPWPDYPDQPSRLK